MATDSRIDRLETEVSQLGQRMARVEGRLDSMDQRLTSLENRLNTLTMVVFGNIATTILTAVGIIAVVLIAR